MIEVKKYTKANRLMWNDFVKTAKNATFLFHRDYMDYHADRFIDHSALIFQDGKLKSVFAANEENGMIISHGGLSYGGLILEKEARLEDVLSFFYYLLQYYNNHNSKEIIYKCLPSYLATHPSQEELYAMFLLEATLINRQTSCVLAKSMPLPYQQRRKSNIKKAETLSYQIIASQNPQAFWQHVLIPNLNDRFGAHPVHSVDEMKLLMSRFPTNIQLYEIYGEEILGGTLIYNTELTAHAQYTSATPLGKQLGALDILFHHLINDVYKEKSFFSFGTSNGEKGEKLNRGLVNWKEGFGARTYCIDSYKLEPAKYILLAEYA